MKKLGKILMILTVPVLVKATGPSDIGGGSAFLGTQNSNPVLLDLYTAGIRSTDNSTFLPYRHNVNENLKPTSFEAFAGFNFLNTKEERLPGYSPSHRKAKEISANIFSHEFPKFSELLQFSFEQARFVYTFHNLKPIENIFIPSSLKAQTDQIKTVVYYDRFNSGIIDAHLFNRFHLISQIGLFVHEAHRRLQIVYQLPLSDEEIQHITYYVLNKAYNFENDDSLNNNDILTSASKTLKRLENILLDNQPINNNLIHLQKLYLCKILPSALYLENVYSKVGSNPTGSTNGSRLIDALVYEKFSCDTIKSIKPMVSYLNDVTGKVESKSSDSHSKSNSLNVKELKYVDELITKIDELRSYVKLNSSRQILDSIRLNLENQTFFQSYHGYYYDWSLEGSTSTEVDNQKRRINLSLFIDLYNSIDKSNSKLNTLLKVVESSINTDSPYLDEAAKKRRVLDTLEDHDLMQKRVRANFRAYFEQN